MKKYKALYSSFRKGSLLMACGLGVLAAQPAFANSDGEQDQARKDVRAGNVRSLREIESRVLPSMRGTPYLGPEYNPVSMVYRLKFIQSGRVIFVDVDARTGMEISRK